MELAKQLKIHLDDRGMTAAELSRKAKVAKSVISKWMAGGKVRDLDQLKRVADVLATDISHLCYGKGLPTRIVQPNDISSLFGSDWVSGRFEIKIRKIGSGQE